MPVDIEAAIVKAFAGAIIDRDRGKRLIRVQTEQGEFALVMTPELLASLYTHCLQAMGEETNPQPEGALINEVVTARTGPGSVSGSVLLMLTVDNGLELGFALSSASAKGLGEALVQSAAKASRR